MKATAGFKKTNSGLVVPDSVADKPRQSPPAPYKIKFPPLRGRIITCCICGLSGGSLVKVDSERYRHTFCMERKRRS